MYRFYHVHPFRRQFGTILDNGVFVIKNRKLLYRKATPYKRRKTSESCPGGLASFQDNIRRLRPLHLTPSMPTIKTCIEEEDNEEL